MSRTNSISAVDALGTYLDTLRDLQYAPEEVRAALRHYVALFTPNTLPANGGVSDAANELINDPLSEFVCSDCGTPLYVGHDCHKCGGFGADTPEQWAAGKAVRDSKGTPGKYDDVLKPFFRMMEAELHANCGKGDRPGWLTMTPQTALLEIYYHVSKLQKAVKNNDHGAIREYSADVANMSMMLLDVCVGIPAAPHPAPAQQAAGADEQFEKDVAFWMERGHTREEAETEVRYRAHRSRVKAIFDPGASTATGRAGS